MARKVKTSVSKLKGWDEVNRALKQLCECEIAVETLAAEAQGKINDIRDHYDKLLNPYRTTVEVLEAQIEDFATMNTEDLDGKSKQLTFGVVGFRKSTRISYSTKKTDDIIEKLKKHNMLNCINKKETINKEALILYPEKDIEKVGAKKVMEDNFYCETDREKLRG